YAMLTASQEISPSLQVPAPTPFQFYKDIVQLKDPKADPDDCFVTYGTLNLSEPSQEEDGEDENVCENNPRK
ncbi:hypothetical protein chiPu_0029163, partial [Chiloscyllium punctatum]|nr:hypothetical protein [Chiloscyllium punctatum]